MDWTEALKLSIIPAIFTAIATFFTVEYRDRRQRTKDGSYYALRLALALERFGYDCQQAISDRAIASASQGAHGKYMDRLPDLVFPEDTNWKSLDAKLVNRLLAMPTDIVSANSAIEGAFANLDPDEMTNEPDEQAGFCGHRALLLAAEIREFYKLISAAELSHPWSTPHLRTYHDEKAAVYNRWNRTS